MTLFDRARRVAALLADPRTPKLPRLAVLLAVVYLLLPVDAFPEMVFTVAGYLDDLVLLWLALRWLVGSAPKKAAEVAETAEKA